MLHRRSRVFLANGENQSTGVSVCASPDTWGQEPRSDEEGVSSDVLPCERVLGVEDSFVAFDIKDSSVCV